MEPVGHIGRGDLANRFVAKAGQKLRLQIGFEGTDGGWFKARRPILHEDRRERGEG